MTAKERLELAKVAAQPAEHARMVYRGESLTGRDQELAERGYELGWNRAMMDVLAFMKRCREKEAAR